MAGIPIPGRKDSGVSAGGTPRMMSITTQMAQQGMEAPKDLIASLLVDHERSRSMKPTAAVPPQMQTPDITRMRSDSSTLKRTHWKQLEKVPKCCDSACRRKFTWKDRRRNCCMCGEVFCRSCTTFRKKLSTNAEPDPLGTFQHVCRRCFEQKSVFGASQDHIHDFCHYRRSRKASLQEKAKQEKNIPIPHRDRTESKRTAIRDEADRLTDGFQAQTGWMKNLVSEVRTPNWHKSPHWKPSGRVKNCFDCKKGFRITSRKIHCRICGQVFCTECTKDEIILYMDKDDSAKWAINGKSGGPSTSPDRYELLPTCRDCSQELQEVMLQDLTVPEQETVYDFMDHLTPLQKKLYKLITKIEASLPNYQKVVDTLDIEDSSPTSVKGRHPLRDLAKAQSDLSDFFSQLAVKSQELKQLQPLARSDTQQRLLRHIMIGTYQFYSENMYLFRASRDRLAEFTPLEGLEAIQAVLNQQSMERVHIILQQIIYEVLDLQKRYNFDDSFFVHIVEPIKHIEDEYKAYVEKRGESWEEHCECVKEMIQDDMKNDRRKIVISRTIPRRQTKSAMFVMYKVVLKCCTIAHECQRELEAKTSDREFPRTKESLKETCDELITLLPTIKQTLAAMS